MNNGTAIVWLRRDLRLADHAPLQAALEAEQTPLFVYLHAPEEEDPWRPGAASRAWLHHSLTALAGALRDRGSRLIIRTGPSLKALERLIDESGAEAVFWHRRYEPAGIAVDRKIKQALSGVEVKSFAGALLTEPWMVKTGGGEPYQRFTPYWRAASEQVGNLKLTDPPAALPAPKSWPSSLTVEDLGLLPSPPEPRWDREFWERWTPGETGANTALEEFVDGALKEYDTGRDLPAELGTSRLSPHLHFGEIAVRRVFRRAAAEGRGSQYLTELGWREFAHHLLYHFPRTTDSNLNSSFDDFGWVDVDADELHAWQTGTTGIPIVDAGMRELWATGWMHNRVRMIVASLLCKNLRYHWIHGARWFWDTLVDADLANNTLGWQWTAGTGADAAPYFRVFNPVRQAERFDPDGAYIHRWVPELRCLSAPACFAPWEHPDRAKADAPDYPATPIVDLKASRQEALAELEASKKTRSGS